MWEILADFGKHYKSTVIKLTVALFFVFLLVQYNSYGKRANAHTLNLQIKSGMIDRLCITSSKNITFDKNGVYAQVKEQKVYIPDQWGNITKRDNLNIAIVMNEGRYNRRVYEVDDRNANLLLQKSGIEGCRSFSAQKKKAIF